MARVLVTGATGQIGSYLAELLVAEGHEVVGIGSPTSTRALPAGTARARGAWTERDLDTLLFDNGALDAVVLLGAITDIPRSWEAPEECFDVCGRLPAFAATRLARRTPRVRLVHASSSNVFGVAKTKVQDEDTPIAPVSPYGVAKAAGQLGVTLARTGMGLLASNLVYFQAVSPRCPERLVVRKITRGVASVVRGKTKRFTLGTTHIVRDVAHARDFARAARLLALEGAPGDYVCASGEGRSIAEMARVACAIAGLDAADCIEEETGYHRPNDIPSLVGDVRKLRAIGWRPEVTFEALVRECLEHDLAALD